MAKSPEYTNMVGLYAQLTQIGNKTMRLTMLLNMQERGQGELCANCVYIKNQSLANFLVRL